MSSLPSHAQELYDALIQLYGGTGPGAPFDFTPGSSYAEAKVYAWAMGLARDLYEFERAGNQAYPTRAYDLLPLLELDFGITPGPKDSIPTRAATVAAAMLLPNGAVASNIVNGLRAILGSGFYAYIPAPGGQSSFGPTSNLTNKNLGSYSGNFVDVRIPARLLQLVDPVTTQGLTWCAYKNWDTTLAPQLLLPGDVVIVSGENTALLEKVTVAATATMPPAGSNASSQIPAGTPTWTATTLFQFNALVQPTTANANGFWFKNVTAGAGATGAASGAGGTGPVNGIAATSGATEPAWPSIAGAQVQDGGVLWQAVSGSYCFQANYANGVPHDVGASITTGPLPFWYSTQRFAWIVCTPATAQNRELRRKVDTFMQKAARGISQWAIVQATTPGTVDTLTVNGPMGCAPLSGTTYTNSM